jgi:hypothetical protein
VSRAFDVRGRVIDRGSGAPLAGLRVEAWDRDTQFHSMLGAETTNADGRFAIRFGEEAYGDFGGDALPDVYFKVLDGDVQLENTFAAPKPNLAEGVSEHVLVVQPRPGVPEPPPAPLPDLTVGEIGEALAATVASVQQELAHYPMAMGTFVVDELAVDVPVRYSVDTLGQLRVRVEPSANGSTSNLRLRIRPVLDPPEPRSVTAPQPLSKLGVLPADAIRRLEAQRVFSVDDLLRVSRNAAGRRALEELGVPELDGALDRARVIALPSLPAPVAESLVAEGIGKPGELLAADPRRLAKKLSARLGEPIDEADVTAWQDRTRPLVALMRPQASEGDSDE